MPLTKVASTWKNLTTYHERNLYGRTRGERAGINLRSCSGKFAPRLQLPPSQGRVLFQRDLQALEGLESR